MSAGRRGVETHLIRPADWGDLWIHGKDILLLGWMRHDEFRLRAEVIPVGSRVFQFSRTRTKNLAVPVADLKPMERLLAAAPRRQRSTNGSAPDAHPIQRGASGILHR